MDTCLKSVVTHWWPLSRKTFEQGLNKYLTHIDEQAVGEKVKIQTVTRRVIKRLLSDSEGSL